MLIKAPKHQIIAVLMLVICFFVKSYGQTIIFPTDDTYTNEANPNQNFGSELEFKINKANANNEERAYLGFDLNGVSGNFQQILLKLTSTNSSQVSTQLRVLANDLDETNLTWSNQPLDNDFLFHGGITVGNSIYFDVTQVVSEKINQNETLNLLLYSNLISDTSQIFASKESNNDSDKPQLVLLNNNDLSIALFGLQNTTTTTTEEGTFNSIVIDTKNQFEDTIDQYGGLIQSNISYPATGYFKTQLIDGVWNFIDPLGNIFYSVGLNSVDDTAMLNLPQDLTNLGINTLGSWSDETINNIAYTPNLNILRKYQNAVDGDAEISWDAGVLPVWEDDFETFVNASMPGWLAPYLSDPYLLGYFLDNELKFSITQIEDSLGLEPTNNQYINANQYMIDTYGAGYSLSQITFDDETEYVRRVADKYLSVTTTAVRAVDPNHLILGSRLNGNVRYRIPVIEKTSEYCDVMSINYYREWEILQGDWEFWSEYSSIPWITTEFYTKGIDAEGNPDDEGDIINNNDGAGWLVATQNDRAVFFENYVIKTLEDPKCIGYHWFRFIDNNQSNKGLYDSNFVTYPELSQSFDQVNNAKYALRDMRLRGYSTSSSGTLSTDELTADTTINIYPNPTTNVLNISFSNQLEDYSLSLYNLEGRLIKTFSNTRTIELNGVATGIYLLEIKDLKSSYKTVKKIAIQK